MMAWFNYVATAKILIFGLLAGCALPALFAVAVRLGDVVAAGPATAPRRGLIVLRWSIFTLLVVLVVAGVLFLARDFLEHRIGWDWDDWAGWDDVFDAQ